MHCEEQPAGLAGAKRSGQIEIRLPTAVDLHRGVARANGEFALAPRGNRRHGAASQGVNGRDDAVVDANRKEATAAGVQFGRQAVNAQQRGKAFASRASTVSSAA